MLRTIRNRRNAMLLATGAGLITAGIAAVPSADRPVHDAGTVGDTGAAGMGAMAASLTGGSAAEAATPASAAAQAAGPVGTGLGPDWDLPNVDHPRIDYWVDRFETVPAMRTKFQAFLDRGAPLAPLIVERLEARAMPRDLLYLAMIESGFQTNATSHAAAVGVWQFIGATGRRYGLDIDRAVDERRDPVRATEAALDYLQDLHDRFGSWYLAAAAYNSGEGRVSRAMRAQFGRERARSESEYYAIWHRLPKETRDYVPLMIAAARISKNAEAHGFSPLTPMPMAWDEVTVPPATPLSRIANEHGTTVKELRVLNPHFLIHRTPNDREYRVRVPLGTAAVTATVTATDLDL